MELNILLRLGTMIWFRILLHVTVIMDTGDAFKKKIPWRKYFCEKWEDTESDQLYWRLCIWRELILEQKKKWNKSTLMYAKLNWRRTMEKGCMLNDF